jgi:hypothetical protein
MHRRADQRHLFADSSSGWLHVVSQISVYLFPIVVLLSGIPVFSIIVRYNLLQSNLCRKCTRLAISSSSSLSMQQLLDYRWREERGCSLGEFLGRGVSLARRRRVLHRQRHDHNQCVVLSFRSRAQR